MVELAYLSLKKTIFFCLYFRHISLCFYSNFDRERSLDAESNSASNDHHHVFSGISCFWGSGVRQKYALWVLVGCGVKFHIQRALLIEI